MYTFFFSSPPPPVYPTPPLFSAAPVTLTRADGLGGGAPAWVAALLCLSQMYALRKYSRLSHMVGGVTLHELDDSIIGPHDPRRLHLMYSNEQSQVSLRIKKCL